jgi:hypothetical protein
MRAIQHHLHKIYQALLCAQLIFSLSLTAEDCCNSYDSSGESCCDNIVYPQYSDPDLQTYEQCDACRGIWMPDDPPLFRPFMADPRQVCYSVGWRFDDDALVQNVIPVSYGDSFAFYRWCNVGPWNGQLQIELEGCLWAVFDPCYDSSPLMNADYYVAVPIIYAFDNWQFRLRGFHISSHIGDEFLLNHPHFDRRNPSAEYLDFFISHDLTDEIRVYAGLGYIVAQDESFKFSPFYSAIGGEVRLRKAGFYNSHDLLYGCPILGMYFRQSADFKKHIDSTFVVGYEFGKLCGIYRRLRIFAEYHDGYSVEGQFYRHATSYFSIRTTYGF